MSDDRRLIKMSARPRTDDAVTERHWAAAWQRPEPEPEPEPEADDGDSGWLLGDDDPPAAVTTTSATPDDVTQAIPHSGPWHVPRRRRWLWPGIAAVLVVALAGGIFFARDLFGVFFPADYDGPGAGRVVVQVVDGESTREIGEALVAQDVVASSRAFGQAAEDNPDGRGIQPGYYQVRRQMSAAGAVTALLDPASRVGRLEIRSGTQLDDTLGVGQAIVPGVLSLISQATCTTDGTGARRCTTVAELRAAMTGTDPEALGVPAWALQGVHAAAPERRLEGLLAPGTYDVAPGTGAREALEQVLRESVPRLQADGLVAQAQTRGISPYGALIVASLAEREGVAGDFSKVSRVIYNRLAVPMRLQLDSTVNYPLDRQTLLTTPADRGTVGPYNTYINLGLPPTPIGAVSSQAVRAGLDPTPGPWVYFVKCERDGQSCFAVTPAEHDVNRRLAQQRGVY